MAGVAQNGKNSFLRSWGVRTKLLLSFVLLSLVSTCVYMWIAHSHTRRMAEEHMTQKIELLAGVFSEEIRRDLDAHIDHVTEVASLSDVRSMEIGFPLESRIRRSFSQTSINALFILDAERQIVSASHYDEKSFVSLDKISNSEHVEEAMKEFKAKVFSGEAVDYDRPGAFFIAVPVAGASEAAAGAVVAEVIVDIASMEKLIEKKEIAGGDMRMFLINRDGVVLTHTDPNAIGKCVFEQGMPLSAASDKVRKGILAGEQGNTEKFLIEEDGKKRIVAAAVINPAAGWKLILIQPYERIIAPVIKVRNTIFMWGLLALAVSIYLALYRARRITYPIGELIRASEEISQGHYSQRVTIYRRDEFGWLASAFNRMSADLESKIDALKIYQSQLEEAFNQVQSDAQKREQANRDLSQKVSELTSLAEVTQAITTSLDINEVLNMMVDTIAKIIGIDICSIKLLDPATNKMSVKISRGLGEEYIKKSPTRPGEGVSGRAIKDRVPVIIEDVDTDERVEPDHVIRSIGVKSIISIPLITNVSALGVLNLYTKEKRVFTEDERRLLGIFANQAAGAIENARLFHSLRENYLNTIQALSMAIDAKDQYTHGHSKRVSEIAASVGRAYGLDDNELDLLKYASDLHDIGKIGISEVIIGKKSKLTVDEYDMIKSHPIVGETIIQPVPFLKEVCPIIRHHHERYDGYGYPDGIKGDEIPELARILHLADAFDAMTSDRPYRKALSNEVAIQEVKKHCGTQFDPRVVAAFLKVFDPEGGEIAPPA